MAKTIIKGIKEDGLFDTELKRTPVLITELIHDFPKLCEADIAKRLCEIRESSERDERTIRNFAECLKQNKPKIVEEENPEFEKY